MPPDTYTRARKTTVSWKGEKRRKWRGQAPSHCSKRKLKHRTRCTRNNKRAAKLPFRGQTSQHALSLPLLTCIPIFATSPQVANISVVMSSSSTQGAEGSIHLHRESKDPRGVSKRARSVADEAKQTAKGFFDSSQHVREAGVLVAARPVGLVLARAFAAVPTVVVALGVVLRIKRGVRWQIWSRERCPKGREGKGSLGKGRIHVLEGKGSHACVQAC